MADNAVFAGWIARGLGGASKILDRFADDRPAVNKTHLAEVRDAVQLAIDAYRKLAACQEHGPSDMPPKLNLGGPPEGERDERPAEPTAEPATEPTADSATGEPATADNGPTAFVSSVYGQLRWLFIGWFKPATDGIAERIERVAYGFFKLCRP